MTNHFCVPVLFDYSCDMDYEFESNQSIMGSYFTTLPWNGMVLNAFQAAFNIVVYLRNEARSSVSRNAYC